MCEQEMNQEPNSGDQELAGEAGAAKKAATVLVVDDDGAVIASTRALLEEAGYQILTARHGEQALEVFQAHPEQIDLVILDLVMPRMGGEECLDRLLEIDPEVRVLGTTGYYTDDDTYKQMEPKVKGFIPKPVAPPIFLELVARALRD